MMMGPLDFLDPPCWSLLLLPLPMLLVLLQAARPAGVSRVGSGQAIAQCPEAPQL